MSTDLAWYSPEARLSPDVIGVHLYVYCDQEYVQFQHINGQVASMPFRTLPQSLQEDVHVRLGQFFVVGENAGQDQPRALPAWAQTVATRQEGYLTFSGPAEPPYGVDSVLQGGRLIVDTFSARLSVLPSLNFTRQTTRLEPGSSSRQRKRAA